MCKSLSHDIGFEHIMWSWRTAKTWHYVVGLKEMPEETSENEASVTMETLKLKESWREVDGVWYCEGLGKATGEDAVSAVMETPEYWRRKDSGKSTKNNSRYGI